jgi:hypothetical protein
LHGLLRRYLIGSCSFYRFVDVSPKSIVAFSGPVPRRTAFKTLLVMAPKAGEHARQRLRPCETNMRTR